MGSSSIDGIYDTFDKAEGHLQMLVKEINSRLITREDDLQTLFEKQELNGDEGDVLVRYDNNIRAIEIRQYEINKPLDNFITWYDYD